MLLGLLKKDASERSLNIPVAEKMPSHSITEHSYLCPLVYLLIRKQADLDIAGLGTSQICNALH